MFVFEIPEINNQKLAFSLKQIKLSHEDEKQELLTE